MKIKESRELLKKSQDLLFKRPYIWIITISITSLNFLITYNLQKIDTEYFYYFLVDVFTTYLIIEFYALGIRFLNKKVPIETDFVKRVMYQLTLHTLCVMFFTIILNELFDFLFFSSKRLSLSFIFYTKDTFVALLFVLLFHAIYFGLYLMSNKENIESLNIVPEPKIKVANAHAYKLLNAKEITLAYSMYGVTYIISMDYKRFTSELTLKEFEEIFDDEKFFRANRKYIISKNIVDSYKSSINGKIDVNLKVENIPDLSEIVTVSRDKAALFRKWITK